MRANKLSRKLNISLKLMKTSLEALGYTDFDLNPLHDVPENLSEMLCDIYGEDLMTKMRHARDDIAFRQNLDSEQEKSPHSILEGISSILVNEPNDVVSKEESSEVTEQEREICYRDDKPRFWIKEINFKESVPVDGPIRFGDFSEETKSPVYSVIIGANGAGKSSVLRELVNFFLDVYQCKDSEDYIFASYKGPLFSVIYHIDGRDVIIEKRNRAYLAKVDGLYCPLKNLRLPVIVACHFGAFEKFPNQSVNGASLTRYDVPYYKYVGAHINGNMISSAGIAFRLLFTLCDNIDEELLENICSTLDFIGYDHLVSFKVAYIQKSKKNSSTQNFLDNCIANDREYRNETLQKKQVEKNRLYKYYNERIRTGHSKEEFKIDFNKPSSIKKISRDLPNLYKLKQYGLVKLESVSYYKHGHSIESNELSSGEFTMLSTILSLAVSAKSEHSLILLDEPELSQHPNWQMTLIDCLDRALVHNCCHLLIATHSHLIVSDLPMHRSSVVHLEKNALGHVSSKLVESSTFGWSAEEVLLKVFNTTTDRNRYFGELISKLLEKMGNDEIKPKEVSDELAFLESISEHLSDVDPVKSVLNTILKAYRSE